MHNSGIKNPKGNTNRACEICTKPINNSNTIQENGCKKMKYRKKPVVIEAFQYDGDLKDRQGNYYVPDWAVQALNENTLYFENSELHIKILEGVHHASVGDYIIQGIKGELYPCKPDIFEATYEPVKPFDPHKTAVGRRLDAGFFD